MKRIISPIALLLLSVSSAHALLFSQLPTRISTPLALVREYTVTDSQTCASNAVETGGGGLTCTLYWDGANWIDNPGNGWSIISPYGLFGNPRTSDTSGSLGAVSNISVSALSLGTLGGYNTTTTKGTIASGSSAVLLASIPGGFVTNRWISIAGAGPACASNWNGTFGSPNNPTYNCNQISSMTLATQGTAGAVSWDYQAAVWDGNGGLGADLAAPVTIATGPVYIGDATAAVRAQFTFANNSVSGAALWRAPSKTNKWVLVAVCGHQNCLDEGVVRTVTDGRTNAGTTFTTATSGSFTSLDLNKPINCVDSSNHPIDVPAGAKISAIGGANSITLTKAATGTHSGLTCHIGQVADLSIPNTPPPSGHPENLRAKITGISGNTVTMATPTTGAVTDANVWTDDAGMVQEAVNLAEQVTSGPGYSPHIVELPCVFSSVTGNTCQYRIGSSIVTGGNAFSLTIRCTGGGFDMRQNGPALWVGDSNPGLKVERFKHSDCNYQGVGTGPTSVPLSDGIWAFEQQGADYQNISMQSVPHTGLQMDKGSVSGGGFATKIAMENIRIRSTGYHGFFIGWGHTLDDFSCYPVCFESGAGASVNGGSNTIIPANEWTAGNPYGVLSTISALGSSGTPGYFVHNQIRWAIGGHLVFHNETDGNVKGGRAIQLGSDRGLVLASPSIVENAATAFSTDGIYFNGTADNGNSVLNPVCVGGTHILKNCINLNGNANNQVIGVTIEGTPPTNLVAGAVASDSVPVKGSVTLTSGNGRFSNSLVTTASSCQCSGPHTCTVTTVAAGSATISGTGADVVNLSCD
jgi:hypothetical protein